MTERSRFRRLLPLALALLCALTLATPVFAANHVSDMRIEVELEPDGSSWITQHWRGDFSEGTENYLPVENLDGMSLSDFSVWDEDGPYEYEGQWDVDRSRAEKARRCGVVKTAKGYELCYGIGDYGRGKTYSFRYKIGGMIGAYSDYDGFNFRFVNDGMNTTPTAVTLTLTPPAGMKLDAENCGIWAFGFGGNINFSGGNVVAQSSSDLGSGNHMTLMLQFDKGLFTPARKASGSFEAVKNRAFEGSDYDDDDGAPWWIITLVLLVFVLVIASVVGAVVYVILRKVRLNRFYKEAEYFRDTPQNGDLLASYGLGTNFGLVEEGGIIGATLLRFFNSGALQTVTEKEVSFFGREKEVISLVFDETKFSAQNDMEMQLYYLLHAASGDDGILQSKELEKHCKKQPEGLRALLNQAGEQGGRQLLRLGCFTGRVSGSLKKLTPTGKSELAHLMGHKKFLTDFSLIAERGVQELPLWQEYLVYATLLGIADKVMEQLKELYPDKLPELQTVERNIILTRTYYHSTYGAMHSAESARSAGRGGSSSFGGGGGFSGGGSGGGSR